MSAKQKTYYVRDDLATVMSMIAAREDKRASDLVNEAFEAFIHTKCTKAELKVFGYKQEKRNGEIASGTNSVEGEDVSGGTRRGSGTLSGPPGIKKRAG